LTSELYRSSEGALASCVDVHMHDLGSLRTGSPDGKCLCFLLRLLRGFSEEEPAEGSKLTCVVESLGVLATVTVWGGSCVNDKLSLAFGFIFCLESMEVSFFFSLSAMWTRTRNPSPSAMCTIFLELLDTLEAISVSFLEPTERNFLEELRRTADLDLVTPDEEDVTGLLMDPGAVCDEVE
jgi:hypothetical protein